MEHDRPSQGSDGGCSAGATTVIALALGAIGIGVGVGLGRTVLAPKTPGATPGPTRVNAGGALPGSVASLRASSWSMPLDPSLMVKPAETPQSITPGWAHLHVLPIDATIDIDGERVLSNYVELSPGPHDLFVAAPGCSPRRLSFGVESNHVVYVSAELKRIAPRPKSPRPTRAGERDLTPDQVDYYRQLLWEQASADDLFDTRRSDPPGVIGPVVRDAIAYLQEQLNRPDPKDVVVHNPCGGIAVDGVLSPATRRMLECWRETSRRRIAQMFG